MAGGLRSDDQDGLITEINVTPLVDVMLVLLVIFIVAAPLMAMALKVDLPHAAAPAQTDAVVIDLTLQRDGGLTVEGVPVSPDTLVESLRQAARAKPEGVLRFGGDADTTYQAVAETLAAVRQAGINRIAFATRHPGDAAAP
ncbi:MAG: biopolymer transporter ExbD [Magnetococcus sp. WYHC-3]